MSEVYEGGAGVLEGTLTRGCCVHYGPKGVSGRYIPGGAYDAVRRGRQNECLHVAHVPWQLRAEALVRPSESASGQPWWGDVSGRVAGCFASTCGGSYLT